MKDLTFLDNIIITHRGLYDNKYIPENSILAFKKSILKNLPIELDVHVLKDYTVVVFHDDNLKRMTGIDKPIEDFTYNELKNIKLLKTNQTIPTLEEVLKLVDGKVLLDIEIKKSMLPNSLNYICKILDNYKGKFIIKSFFPKYIYWLRKNKPDYIRGLLVANKNKKDWYKKLASSMFLYNILKPDFYAYDKTAVESKYFTNLKDKNVPILLWTIKGKQEICKYKNSTTGLIVEEYLL